MRVNIAPALSLVAYSVLSGAKSSLAFLSNSFSVASLPSKYPAPRIDKAAILKNNFSSLKNPSNVIRLCSLNTSEGSTTNIAEWKELTPPELNKLGAQLFSNAISTHHRAKLLEVLSTIKGLTIGGHRKRIHFAGCMEQGKITEFGSDIRANYYSNKQDLMVSIPQQNSQIQNILEEFMHQFSNTMQSSALKSSEKLEQKNVQFRLQLIDYQLQPNTVTDVIPWHRDSLPITCLIMLSDPKDWQGGIISLAKDSGKIPEEPMPHSEFAFLQEAGSAFVFNNKDTLHKITPLTADRATSRVILLLQLKEA